MAMSTMYDPADGFVAYLASEGGPRQLVCFAPTESLCRQRMENWVAIHQSCEVRVMPAGKRPGRRPKQGKGRR